MTLLEFLQTTPLAFYLIMTVIGLIVGSFLNVVILRLPKMLERDWRQQCRALLKLADERQEETQTLTLVSPGSHCPKCGHKITVLENIPVISYFLLRGACSACHQPISIRYPIIEATSGLLALFTAWHYGYGLQALLAMLLAWSLLTLSVIDIDHKLLPDDITLPLLWLGILINMRGVFTDIHSSLIGVVAGYITLWTVYMGFKILTGKEGMGHGDFKLLAMLGAWLGWQSLPLIILFSSVIGTLVGIGLIAFSKHQKNMPIPFGPFLALAGWIVLIWGHELTSVYIQWSIS
jgi:leader peptidase (prepilin peptidase)/N-methyltransferase